VGSLAAEQTMEDRSFRENIIHLSDKIGHIIEMIVGSFCVLIYGAMIAARFWGSCSATLCSAL